MSASDLKQLLIIIGQQLDWGDAADWQHKDFENLNILIFEKTKVSLSASTLRRIWGRVEYPHLPSGTTLDTLSKFAGFENWRAFTKQVHTAKTDQKDTGDLPVKSKQRPAWGLRAALLVIVIAAVSLVSMYARKSPSSAPKGNFTFNSKAVTRTIPNSVVFTYDVKTNPGDSVFMQQSWDPDTKVTLDKERHEYTSIYYRPGFYHAKLGVNGKVVKEHLLMIPTDGWLGLIAHQPVPVYLAGDEFMNKDEMQVSTNVITQKNIPLEPQPPMVEYYNVGNFTPVPLKSFSFDTEVRNDYSEGAAVCQHIGIILFTDNTPVIVPLSSKGCVSDLALLNGRYFVSGKNTDLSGFGADLSKWVKVSCRSVPGKIQYYVDDKLVYESPLPLYNENIVGIGYSFEGTGAVRNVKLNDHGKPVFEAF